MLPFGFGLSYTTFAYSQPARGAPPTVDLAPLRRELDAAEAADHPFVPAARAEAARDGAGWATGALGAAFSVNVTNTGKVDADDVVLGFLTPPGAGTGGVPLKQLFGFERVHVKAGQTVSVFLYPTVGTFTQVDADGRRRALAGRYTFRFGVAETAPLGMGFVESRLLAEDEE